VDISVSPFLSLSPYASEGVMVRKGRYLLVYVGLLVQGHSQRVEERALIAPVRRRRVQRCHVADHRRPLLGTQWCHWWGGASEREQATAGLHPAFLHLPGGSTSGTITGQVLATASPFPCFLLVGVLAYMYESKRMARLFMIWALKSR